MRVLKLQWEFGIMIAVDKVRANNPLTEVVGDDGRNIKHH